METRVAEVRWRRARCVRCTLPASHGGKRSEGRLMLELLGLQACSLPSPTPLSLSNSTRRRFRALRVRMKIEEREQEKRSPPSAVPVRKTMVPTRAPPLQTTRPSTSSVFLHNSIIRFFLFFYVDASCSENMEFLKGPRTPPCTCQRPAAAAAVAASSSPRCR